jgi:hypothetical protein
VSGELDRDLAAELIAELEALLERAAGEAPAKRASAPPARAPIAGATSWQEYASELRDLCQRVLEEADEETARAFWRFLLEVAARHGRRAGGWRA